MLLNVIQDAGCCPLFSSIAKRLPVRFGVGRSGIRS